MKYSCFTNLHYFCCIAKWISYTDTHILFFWISFPFRWSQSILLYSRFSCVTYFIHNTVYMGLPWWLRGKEFDCNLETEFDSQVGKIPWRRAWQPTPVFLPGESPLRGAWRATVLRVATSRTQLKWPHSSSSGVCISVLTFHSSHHRYPRPFSPWQPYICSLHLCLYFCFANKFICTILNKYLI